MRELAVAVAVAVTVAAAAPASGAQETSDDEARILVFTRTASFRHLSIPNAVAAFQSLGEEHGFEVEHTEDHAIFNDADLARFDAVAFVLTTGNVVPRAGEEAFERYIRGGGGYIGVHSASDTEYEWEFYGELLAGAYFLSHPVQQPGVIVRESADHPSTAHLPERWTIPFEEFYSFTANPRPRSRVLLSIDESTYQQDPNTSHIPREPALPEGESGVMGDHPMSWCHDVGEGRSWYTALGHEGYLYELPDFRRHLLGGIMTTAGVEEADCAVGADAGPVDEETAPPEPAPSEESAPRPLPVTGGGWTLLALTGVALGSALTAARRRSRRRH